MIVKIEINALSPNYKKILVFLFDFMCCGLKIQL